MARENMLCFVANDKEKQAIKENAKERNLSMSAFIRGRAVRAEMTNNELADMMMSFIGNVIKTRPSYSDAARILKPPPAAKDITIEMAGMSEEKKKVYMEAERGRREARGKLMEELKECLEGKKDRCEAIEFLDEDE